MSEEQSARARGAKRNKGRRKGNRDRANRVALDNCKACRGPSSRERPSPALPRRRSRPGQSSGPASTSRNHRPEDIIGPAATQDVMNAPAIRMRGAAQLDARKLGVADGLA